MYNNKMKTFESYYYNFNPRDGPKDIKLRYLMKTGIMRRADIPIGKFEKDHKFETSCASYYLRYNDCLTRNMFDMKICRENENSVITCEHEQGLYPKPDDLIARLRLGLENSKKRRERINAKLQEEFSKINKSSNQNAGSEIEPLTAEELAVANDMSDTQHH